MKILLVALLCVPLAHCSTASSVNNEATDASSPWLSGLLNLANGITGSPVNNNNDAIDGWLSGVLNLANDITGSPDNNDNDAIDGWLSGVLNLANDITGSPDNNDPIAPSPWLNGVFNFANEILETIEQSVANELLKRAEKDTANSANNGVNVKPSMNRVPNGKPAHPKGANKRPVNFAENDSTNMMEDYCWDTTIHVDDKRAAGVDIIIKRPGKVARYHHNILVYPKLTEVYCNDDRGVRVTFYLTDMTKQLFWYRP